MTDTPEPCGCRAVELGEGYGHAAEGPTIIYCPTHAAAFENKARADENGYMVLKEQAKNADLLAALRAWIRHYEQSAPDDANPSDPEWALWEQSRAAIAKAKGERRMTDHTPGPWEVAHVDDEHYAVDEVAHGADEAWGKQVADSIRTEADARLIAAAPDLLAACERFEKRHYTQPIDPSGVYYMAGEDLQAILAAIAQAKGEK